MSQRRRILITQKFSSLGGSQKSLVHHLELLDRNRFDVRLLVSREGWLTGECDRLGIPWQLERFRHWNLGSLPGNWAQARRISALIREQQISLVHANEHWVGPHSLWAARKAGVPVICHFRTGLKDLSQRRIRKYRYASFDRVLPVANVLRKALIRHLQDAEKVVVVRDGIEVGEDDAASWRTRRTRIVATVGAIYEVKGQAKILEHAIPWLKAERRRFVLFIGGSRSNSKYIQIMKRRVKEVGLERQVLFLGARSDVPRLLKAADVLAAYSTVEGIPRVVMEAMAARRPVIVSNTPGMDEVVTDGVTGRIVNFDDNDGEFGKALDHLAVDYARWEDMGLEGRRRAASHYSVQTMSLAIQNIYSELLPANE